jgi:hypothetical protein
MQQLDFYNAFIRKLNDLQVRYMVTGSVAAIFYGEPRLTHDVDLVLVLGIGSVKRFVASFPDDEYYCPPKEVIGIELKRETHAHFNLIHHATGLKADCYLFTGDALHRWALDRSRWLEIEPGCSINLAPPEYVILRKLEYFKEGGSQKHLKDIAGILSILGEDIDFQFLKQEINVRGLSAAFEQIHSKMI